MKTESFSNMYDWEDRLFELQDDLEIIVSNVWHDREGWFITYMPAR